MLELKTKSDYVENHIILWDKIISMLECGDERMITFIKQEAFKSLWPKDSIVNQCFGCEWSIQNNSRSKKRFHAPVCKKCLFEIDYKSGCLNNLYNKLAESEGEDCIDLAKQIRNFPVK
jgi:hypothetical protein